MAQEEIDGYQADETEQEEAASESIDTLKQALAVEKEKAESYLANWQRAQADFSNFKKRSGQEKEETIKFANSLLMLSLLPVLDDLERAFTAIPSHLDKLSWVDGIKLIERKLRATLEGQGLSQIKALGELFDPQFHEAATQGKGKEGIIVDEIQKGYKFHDRIIRPSMVVVGNGEEKENEEA